MLTCFRINNKTILSMYSNSVQLLLKFIKFILSQCGIRSLMIFVSQRERSLIFILLFLRRDDDDDLKLSVRPSHNNILQCSVSHWTSSKLLYPVPCSSPLPRDLRWSLPSTLLVLVLILTTNVIVISRTEI